jgi:hypothetical protein
MALSQCKSILNFTTVKSANQLTREVLKLSVFNAVHSEKDIVDIANLKNNPTQKPALLTTKLNH